jgi:hypothetical protein
MNEYDDNTAAIENVPIAGPEIKPTPGLNGPPGKMGSGIPTFIPGILVKHLIDYKYNEGESLKEIQSYIDATYDQHYSRNKFQATEFIIDAGHGTGFNIGNMMKYTQRYGRKGDPAEWRKDLLKVIHYAIMQLHVHDTENKD